MGTLRNYFLPPCLIILRHNNDTKHRSRLAITWFNGHCVLLPWPSSSPDINTIEHVREGLDHYLHLCRQFSRNLRKLRITLQDEWYESDSELIQKLYGSILGKIAIAKDIHGLYTRYWL